MPHVGGGSHSGGFHSGSSSSSTTYHSIPRKDVYGNLHSPYYRRPGFYYRHTYVPYSNVHRRFNALKSSIIMVIIGIIICISAFFLKNVASKDSLTDFSIDRYNEVYDNEKNVLIEIVAYDNLKEFDYLPIVGDQVSYRVDNTFGNEESLFGKKLLSSSNIYENKISNLNVILSKSFDEEIIKYLKYEDVKNNPKNNGVINTTNFEIGDLSELNTILNNIYDSTGLNITIHIDTYNKAYNSSMKFFIIFSIGSIFVIISLISLIKSNKAVNEVNKALNNGEGEKYYEGEIKYDEQLKRHDINNPFRYNNKMYDDLRKKNKNKDDNGLEF